MSQQKDNVLLKKEKFRRVYTTPRSLKWSSFWCEQRLTYCTYRRWPAFRYVSLLHNLFTIFAHSKEEKHPRSLINISSIMSDGTQDRMGCVRHLKRSAARSEREAELILKRRRWDVTEWLWKSGAKQMKGGENINSDGLKVESGERKMYIKWQEDERKFEENL